ncbi:hypothetical protein, conserved [Trypanosoma brucei brucei TREU927]|uniref:ATP-grasp domain-containing protein n=1 Tax=Trypanosoma brucei brucei (strain 927/4 GUTat10.1) TaxID=185431 RepID=Q384P9_TRYB2|nr:hypothetical protein, conserved [Trypanosoma brucei brucei TREU927]EAN79732.1 hypothetical protein, conserved [Trypanosoma brucei brucei TREU927]
MPKEEQCSHCDKLLQTSPTVDNEDYARLINYLVDNFGCSWESAQCTVRRHWPNVDACVADLRRKERPCLVAVEVYLLQREHMQDLAKSLLPIDSSQLPCFSKANLNGRSKGYPLLTWAEVAEKINSGPGIEVHFVDTDAADVLDGPAAYEDFYQRKVVTEGFSDIVAFVTAVDGVVPLVDYLHRRHFGDPDTRRLAYPYGGSGRCCRVPRSISETYARAHAQVPCCADAALSTARRTRILLGNDPATSVSKRQDKSSMQNTLKEHGLLYIKGFSGRDVGEMKRQMRRERIMFPVIVKPVSGAGSEFVTLCYDENDVDIAFAVSSEVQTTQQTDASHMLLQEYIEGPEYVVNVVSYMGIHVVSDVWKSWKYPYPVKSTRLRPSVEKKLMQSYLTSGRGREPVPHTTTVLMYDRIEFVHELSKLPASSEERRVVAYTLKCLDALGLQQGCSHCEVRVDNRPGSSTKGMPVLIELNARMLGDVPRATSFVGYDQYKLMMYLLLCASSIPEDEFSRLDVSGEHCGGDSRDALPWPPAPQLYNSLKVDVTLHVVFVRAAESSYLCIPGFRAIQALPTYKNLTRNSTLEDLKPGMLLAVCKTFDLLTSPGAIVMEGTDDDIRRDTAYIRRVENKDMREWKDMIDAAVGILNSVYVPLSSTQVHTPLLASAPAASNARMELCVAASSLIQSYERARLRVFDYFETMEPPLFIPMEYGEKLRRLDATQLICGV